MREVNAATEWGWTINLHGKVYASGVAETQALAMRTVKALLPTELVLTFRGTRAVHHPNAFDILTRILGRYVGHATVNVL